MSSVKLPVAQATSIGAQDFTVSGFGTPKAAIALGSIGLVDGTVANHAILGMGAKDGSRDWCFYGRAKDGITLGLTKCGHLGPNHRCVVLEDPEGVTLVETQFSAWVTDGMRLNFTTAPASAP